MGDAGVPGNADRAGENGQPSRSLEERVARLELELAALQSKLGSERPAARTSAAPAPAVIAARLPVAAESEAVPAAEVWVRTAKQEPASAAGAAMESFENRLGSQIFNRTAIVSLLIGAAYGMKLAVDRGWLGPAPRVILGLVAGAGLVVWSERFRRNGFAVFSYSLKAVGSGVLYLSLWAAFQRFHLLPAGAALAPMVLVTAWNAYMAWVQDSELLAAYALTGGFATPLLVSTGGNHEIFLFSYLLAIDVATAALVRLKTWPQLLVGAFPVTVLFFIGWYSSYYDASDLETTSIFIVLFGAAFGGVPVGRIAAAQAVRFASQATLVEDILLPMANAAFVALAGYSVLQDAGHHAWLPWLMLVLAAVYLGLMRAPQTRTAEAIHLSLAVVFLTIAIPLKASGAWITVSWLVEGAALVWVAARLAATKDGHPPDAGAGLASRVLRPLALSSLLLGFCGIVLHTLAWASVSDLPLLNKGTGTALVGIALFALAAWIALGSGLDDEEESGRSALGWGGIAATTFVLSGTTAFLLTVRELVGSWRLAELASPVPDG